MPTPNAEDTRAKVAEELQKQPPTSWREIKRRYKVGDQFISDVKRKLGLPMAGQKRPPAPPPAPPSGAPPTGGNGMDEFIPPEEPKAAPKPSAPKASAPAESKGAPGGARSDAVADERPVYECGACEAQWRLAAGESPVSTCPACEVSLS